MFCFHAYGQVSLIFFFKKSYCIFTTRNLLNSNGYGKVSELKKKTAGRWRGGFGGLFFRWIQNDSPYSDVTGSPFKLPTDSPRDLKWQIRTVTCRCFRQNHRHNHRWKLRRWNRQKKLIYDSSADPFLPYFSFFFLIPTLPICKELIST